MAKAKSLTAKERRLVKATAEGKDQTTAGLEADPNRTPESARVWANQTLQKATVQQALEEAFKAHGITMDRVIKPISDGLDATKTVIIGKDEDAFADQIPDHATRLKASGMALNLMGAGKQEGGASIHFHIHQSEQRQKYGL